MVQISEGDPFNLKGYFIMKLGLLPLQKPKRTFVIGDVHGERIKLRKIFAYLKRNLKQEDHVVFCGDLVDAGPDSPGVLLDIIEFKKGHQNTYIVRGNHEIMMLKAILYPAPGDWYTPNYDRVYNVGWQLINRYGVEPSRQGMAIWMEANGVMDLLQDSLPYYETERIVVTHAPINQKIIDDKALEPHEGLLERLGDTLLWDFQQLEDAEVEGVDKLLICGHQNNWGKNPQPRYFPKNRRLFLDTGSGYKKENPLACVEIDEDGNILNTILARADD